MATKFVLALAVLVVLGCLVDLADDGFLGRGEPFYGILKIQLAKGSVRLGSVPFSSQSRRPTRTDPAPAPVSDPPARC